MGRIGEQQPGGWRYHLGDVLGSVRQLADATSALTLARSYEPYGETLASVGDGATAYAFAGEWADNTGLVHLRARYYSPGQGRFVGRDEWPGRQSNPQSLNRWNYVTANPINLTDPTGRCARGDKSCLDVAAALYRDYGWYLSGTWSLSEAVKLTYAANAIERWFDTYGGDGRSRMRGALSPVTFQRADWLWSSAIGAHHVELSTVYLIAGFSGDNVIHELGHVLDNLTGTSRYASIRGGGPSDEMARFLGIDPTRCRFRFACPKSAYRKLLDEAQAELPPTDYGLNGPSEDFADTFWLSVTAPHELDLASPIRAGWLEGFAAKLDKTRPPYEGNPYFCKSLVPVPVPEPPR